jgi:hypothetical protein
MIELTIKIIGKLVYDYINVRGFENLPSQDHTRTSVSNPLKNPGYGRVCDIGSVCLLVTHRDDRIISQGRIKGGAPPVKLEKIRFFTRNTPKIVAPPSAPLAASFVTFVSIVLHLILVFFIEP